MGILGRSLRLNLISDKGFKYSHSSHSTYQQLSLFKSYQSLPTTSDILEVNPPPKYDCSPNFVSKLKSFLKGDLSRLNCIWLIDYCGGNSIHS